MKHYGQQITKHQTRSGKGNAESWNTYIAEVKTKADRTLQTSR